MWCGIINMRAADAEHSNYKFKILKIIIGTICILMGIAIIAGSHVLGVYSIIFLASISLIMMGVERVITGITMNKINALPRIINITLGAGIVIFFASGFFNPTFMIKYYNLMLSFGLLANSCARIISIIKKNRITTPVPYMDIFISILLIIVGLVVLFVPTLGFYLLLLIIAFALLINGAGILLFVIFNKQIRI